MFLFLFEENKIHSILTQKQDMQVVCQLWVSSTFYDIAPGPIHNDAAVVRQAYGDENLYRSLDSTILLLLLSFCRPTANKKRASKKNYVTLFYVTYFITWVNQFWTWFNSLLHSSNVRDIWFARSANNFFKSFKHSFRTEVACALVNGDGLPRRAK